MLNHSIYIAGYLLTQHFTFSQVDAKFERSTPLICLLSRFLLARINAVFKMLCDSTAYLSNFTATFSSLTLNSFVLNTLQSTLKCAVEIIYYDEMENPL